MSDKSETAKKRREAGLKTQFKPGNPGGPGHPKGVPNYRQRFNQALEAISQLKAPQQIMDDLKKTMPDLNAKTISDLEAARVHVAMLQGEEWAFKRAHGLPQQSVDLTSNGESINDKYTHEEKIAIAKALRGLESNREK